MLKCDDKWLPGIQFTPKQQDVPDPNGIVKKSIQLRYRKNNSEDIIYITNWNDFEPNKEGLNFGQPLSCSYAAYFNVDKADFNKCVKIKIVAEDYLGNRYKNEKESSRLFIKIGNHFLEN